MKKIIGLLTILFMAGMIFANGSKESSSKGPYKMKFGNTAGEKDTQTMGLYEVAKRLNASGLFAVEVFPSSALGDTDDIVEQGLQGAPVLTVTDPGRIMSYISDFGVIQMPYMFEDASGLNDLIQTPLYKEWEKEFEKKFGLKLITSNWYSGARNFVCDKEINKPSDLKGLKIRTIGSPLYTESIKAMGAVPTPMAWSEVYSAIQQKAIDGAEVQTPSSYATRLYEISKVTNRTGHFQLIGCVVMGADVFNSWSKEAQDLFVKTFREVGTENQALVKKLTVEYEKEMAAKGMIIRDLDKTPFIEAVQPVYATLGYTKLRDELFKQLGKK
ncbi:TRAP transporter substrate-binding protein DctP [Treponema parvum]|uniref:TRAP transporter substrate-binding protein DctP n=1 Tax=Treponema parvum TaxID=138851 RepID=A0A975F3J9_9SPIR|nr:C4-dicarboxylate TRAP transporter substrate-binding protein [Treponema parvum]QTQ13856.1 TRAP transporter substrate-binding protein DctP [Treponema parvum]